jgi:Tfp pilus assembly protein PilF
MSAPPIRRIHLLGFVQQVRHIHEHMPDRRFCFILGAGASKMSLIPTAGELGVEWLRSLHLESGGAPNDFDKWLREGKHVIAGLPPNTSSTDIGVIAAAYPAIYQAKWGHDRAQGHAEIERHIEAARPSYGYYALSEILASDDPVSPSRHNVVITPNFDNLPADTLGALGKKVPIVIGHSAIAGFARPTLRRPLIIKFHHDFLLAPKSDPKDVENMEKGYSQALTEIFRLYTPIVVGYGGNDGSLMGMLENLPERSIPGGILWCYRKGDPVSQRIENVVSRQSGTLVEIPGFDELMTLLEEPFGHAFNPDKLSERAEARAKELKAAKGRLTKKMASDLAPPPMARGSGDRAAVSASAAAAGLESVAVLDALSAEASSSGQAQPPKQTSQDWWHWQQRINETTDLDNQDLLFQEALAATGNAHQLMGNYANFLADHRKDYAGAEKYYVKAIAADPSHTTNLSNYAVFLETQSKDYDRAEEYYLKAIASDPNHARSLANYARFLVLRRKDIDSAEEYYRKALVADPNRAVCLSNYALFLNTERKDNDRAEEYYRKAIAADPNNARILGYYANFLETQRKDYDRAREFFSKAISTDPNDANPLINFVQFLIGRGRIDQAMPLVRQAWDLLSNDRPLEVTELAFSRWLLAAMAEANEMPALGRLKTILHAGFDRSQWTFDAMLEACVPKLTPEKVQFARKLAAAILDEAKLPELEADPLWQAVQPIPLDAPWPNEDAP